MGMSRRKARENAFVSLFATSFGGSDVQEILDISREDEAEYAVDEFGEGLLRLYAQNADVIDENIQAKLKGWSVKRLQKVSLAILRMSVAEMLYGEGNMDSIIINEAVELAKRFGDEEDYQFINGVLGSISREAHGEAAEAGAGNEAPC